MIVVSNTSPILDFEDELADLKSKHRNCCYDYPDPNYPNKKFTGCTTAHFKKYNGEKVYGIYVVRRKSDWQVLYIGRAGKIKQDGKIVKQDIPERLKKLRENDILANKWFGELSKCEGTLTIEYVVLTNPIKTSSGLVEAILLQAYLNEKGCLPCKNKEF